MNYEACDGARLISLLNIRGISEIRVRLLSPRKRIIDSWCLVLNTDCTDLTNRFVVSVGFVFVFNANVDTC